MDETVELKPCPFCGAKRGLSNGPLPFDIGEERQLPWHVYCWSCRVEGPSALTESEAVAAWNRRSSGPVGDREGVKAVLFEKLRGIMHDNLLRAVCENLADAILARLPAPGGEVERLREALDRIHGWLVCACIASPEDMAQAFPQMAEIAEAALEGPRDAE